MKVRTIFKAMLFSMLFSLTSLSVGAQSSISMDRPEIYAVIIGVGDYLDPGLDKLKYSNRDADEMYQFVMSPNAGSVPPDHIVRLTGKDATRQNIIKNTARLFRLSTKNDMIIFYFSGHGKGGEFDDSGFLLPFDTDLEDLISSAVPMEQIASIINASEAKMKSVYIDACHAGLYPTGPGFKGSRTELNEGTATAFTTLFSRSEGGRMAVLSSKGKEESKESETLKHGIFTHFLLEGLKGGADLIKKDDIVSAGELDAYLTTQVSKYSGNKQHPLILGQVDPDFPLSVVNLNKQLTQLIKNKPYSVSSTSEITKVKPADLTAGPAEKEMNPKICNDTQYNYGVYNFVNATGKPIVMYLMKTKSQGINIGYTTPANLLIPPGGKGKTPRIKISRYYSSAKKYIEEATDYVFYFVNNDQENPKYCTMDFLVESCKEVTVVLTEKDMNFGKIKPR